MIKKSLQFDKSRLDWTTLEFIASGSYGRVLKASLKTSPRYRIVKLIKKSTLTARNQLDHLINEIGSLNALDDAQCILKLHGLIETRFYAVLVTDYIEGPNLLDYTHFQPGHKLCSYSAKQFIAQAYLALDAMHKRSLVHRDIKPDNMMVNGKGQLSLIDFGFAKSFKEGKCFTQCGTPQYMAPQVINNQGHGFESDLWSLGVVLYQLLEGRQLFDVYSDPFKIYEKVKQACKQGIIPFQFQNSNPTDISFIKGLVQVKPNKRLGCGKNKEFEIKNHPYFVEVNLLKLQKGEVPEAVKKEASRTAILHNNKLRQDLQRQGPIDLSQELSFPVINRLFRYD